MFLSGGRQHCRRCAVGYARRQAALRSGALNIITNQDAYLSRGRFDPDRTVAFLEQAVNAAKAQGYTALRAGAEMTWALDGEPGVERLVEYESKVNDFYASHDAVGLCQYSRRRFPREILLGVLHTHIAERPDGRRVQRPCATPPASSPLA